MKIGTCKIGNTTLDVVDDNGVHRFAEDPLVVAVQKSADLNKIHREFLESQSSANPIPLESYLVFRAKSGYSWSGLLDVELSAVCFNSHLFPNAEVRDGEYVSIISKVDYK